MIIADTHAISEVWKPEPDPGFLDWWEQTSDDIATTAVTAGELLTGVAQLPPGRWKQELLEVVTTFIKHLDQRGAILPYDLDAAKKVGSAVSARRQAGKPVTQADAMIAAICLAQDLPLLTRNVRDFEETGVEVVSPWS